MFEYLWGPVIKVTIYCYILAVIFVYTPIGRWSFEYGVFNAVFKGLEAITPEKDISLEDFGTKLTGGRSELIYGPISEQKKRKK